MISALKMTADRTALCGESQPHDVERAERRVGRGERGRDDGEVLGDVVGDAEGRQRAARHQQLLADLDDLEQLGRVGVEVDHVAGLLGRLRAGVHRHRDVGLRQRRRVVGAVAGHRDEVAAACWYSRISASFASGVASARKSSTPASAAIAAAVSGLSPVIITVLMPMRAARRSARGCRP
jgi:hypothetical protein